MTIAPAKNLNSLQIGGADAQGLSPMSADSARFAKTLNDLLMSDEETPAQAVTSVNVLQTIQPTAASGTMPLRQDAAPIDVVAKAPLTPYGELNQKAKELVGTTFFATMLKQMQDSPFKSELFSGGRGGEAFGGMYNQVLSQRMAQRNAEKIVRPIVKKFKAAADAAYERQKNQKQSLNEAKTDVPSNLRA